MCTDIFYSKLRLHRSVLFLMFNKADADGSNDDQAKAPTILATGLQEHGSRGQTGGRSAVRPGWRWEGVAAKNRTYPTSWVGRPWSDAANISFVRVQRESRSNRRDKTRRLIDIEPRTQNATERTLSDGISSRWGGPRTGASAAGRTPTFGPQTLGTCVRSPHGEEKS
jgi:hypothetical protein